MILRKYANSGLPVMMAVLAALVLLNPPPAQAQDMTVELDPARTTVAFTLKDILHTVHGTFQLSSGVVRFNPASGTATGRIVVDVTSGESGNKTRDRKMHNEILQSDKYPEATFIPTHMSGVVSAEGSSRIEVQGIFRLHGTDHPIALTVPLQASGSSLTATIHTMIPYVAWGLKNPSNFLLRVSDKVSLDITTTGRISLDANRGRRSDPDQR